MDAADIVDRYLLATCRTRLEDVLAATTAGHLPADVADVLQVVEVRCLDEHFDDEDGGISERHTGVLRVGGVAYAFSCAVFIDRTGARFIADISKFEAIDWNARVVVPARSA